MASGSLAASEAGIAAAYPPALLRVRGVIIDSVVMAYGGIAAIAALAYAEVGSGGQRLLLALCVALLLDPILVWRTGGSIGHHIVGIRVRRKGSDRIRVNKP